MKGFKEYPDGLTLDVWEVVAVVLLEATAIIYTHRHEIITTRASGEAVKADVLAPIV